MEDHLLVLNNLDLKELLDLVSWYDANLFRFQ